MSTSSVWIDHEGKTVSLKGDVTIRTIESLLADIASVKVERGEEEVVNIVCETRRQAKRVSGVLTGHLRGIGYDLNPICEAAPNHMIFNGINLQLFGALPS